MAPGPLSERPLRSDAVRGRVAERGPRPGQARRPGGQVPLAAVPESRHWRSVRDPGARLSASDRETSSPWRPVRLPALLPAGASAPLCPCGWLSAWASLCLGLGSCPSALWLLCAEPGDQVAVCIDSGQGARPAFSTAALPASCRGTVGPCQAGRLQMKLLRVWRSAGRRARLSGAGSQGWSGQAAFQAAVSAGRAFFPSSLCAATPGLWPRPRVPRPVGSRRCAALSQWRAARLAPRPRRVPCGPRLSSARVASGRCPPRAAALSPCSGHKSGQTLALQTRAPRKSFKKFVEDLFMMSLSFSNSCSS